MSVHAAHAHVSRRLHDTHVKVAARRGWQGVVLPVLLGCVRALWVAVSAICFAVAGMAQGSGVAGPASTGMARAATGRSGSGRSVGQTPPRPQPGTAGNPTVPAMTARPAGRGAARVAGPVTPPPQVAGRGGHMTAGIDIDPEAAQTFAGLDAALTSAVKGVEQQRGSWADGLDAAAGVRLDAGTLGALAAVGDAFDGVAGALVGARQALQQAHSAIHEAVQASGGHMADPSFYTEG